MFKKLRSEREPGQTVLRGIKDEFSVYFYKAETTMTAFLKRYPKPAFYIMLATLLGSVIINFFFHIKPPGKQTALPAASLNSLRNSAGAFSQAMQIKAQVNQLLRKPALSHTDSLNLNQALDSLQKIKP
jgi:hypothetical protein